MVRTGILAFLRPDYSWPVLPHCCWLNLDLNSVVKSYCWSSNLNFWTHSICICTELNHSRWSKRSVAAHCCWLKPICSRVSPGFTWFHLVSPFSSHGFYTPGLAKLPQHCQLESHWEDRREVVKKMRTQLEIPKREMTVRAWTHRSIFRLLSNGTTAERLQTAMTFSASKVARGSNRSSWMFCWCVSMINPVLTHFLIYIYMIIHNPIWSHM